MSNEEWMNLDSNHIVSTEDVSLTCSNCGKEYWYVRDRCPFCYAIKQMFNSDGQVFYIFNHALYTKANGKWYIHNDQLHENVPVETQEPPQPIRDNDSEQQYQQPRQPRPRPSYDNLFSNMISTTIAGLILFALFVIIVAFIDITIFHGA